MTDHLNIFVDEAGCPTLFGKKRGGGTIVGNDGCSQYFIMGKLEVHDPVAVSTALHELHQDILNDPYFEGVPSFDPTYKKTALGFHANADLPEVRRQVLSFLQAQGDNLRFHAVVADKRKSGTFFKGSDLPTLETAFPRRWGQKKKKPRI